jgi:SAM-dependent methyltransferase
MFQQNLAEVYDLIYRGRGKDYKAEAAEVVEHVRARRPDVGSLLDVACGTGEHLVHLAEAFPRVEGLEYTGQMLDVAKRKLPGVPLHSGNMCDFDLGRTFDAAISMFASIAYLRSPEQLNAAVTCIARHVEPGGVLVLEPWYFPERFLEGYISTSIVRDDGRAVARVSRTTRDLRTTHNVNMEIHFTLADEFGMRHFTETQVLSLFSLREHLTAFEQAGCTAEYVEGGPFGCGLFVAVRN